MIRITIIAAAITAAMTAGAAVHAEEFRLASIAAADIRAEEVPAAGEIREPEAGSPAVPAGGAKAEKADTGLRPCQAPGSREVVQCGGSALTYARPGSGGQPLVQAPYYTVNICADADGRQSMEVWPFQFFSSHSEGDMRTIARNVYPSDMGAEVYFMGYSGDQYYGQPQFALTLPKEGDAIRPAVFYNGDSPFGSYLSKGGLYCVVND